MPLTPLDKEQRTPFTTLMRLEELNPHKFRSTCCAYAPGGNVAEANGISPRTYGGHVFAQSAWAAAQTVPRGFICHSVSGSFLRAGISDVPFVYDVQTLQDGRNFCVRSVGVTQDAKEAGAGGLCFRSTCSFKKIEDFGLEMQVPMDVQEQYREVLGEKRPDEFPDPLSSEAPWFIESKVRYTGPLFPGLKSKHVDMDDFNSKRTYPDRRKLQLYTIVGDLPDPREEPNLHAAAHLYASDRNGLFWLSHLLDVQKYYAFTTTLSQSVILHSSIEGLRMTEEDGTPRWFTQEVWTDRYGDTRGVHHSRIWAPDNRHVATTIQDGLIRLDFKTDAEWRTTRDKMATRGKL